MARTHRPEFYEMTHGDSIALLNRHHVGRLAFSFRDRVDVEPISYIYHEGWLYGRTSPGTKLNTVQHSPWVAFQVDEVESRFDWRSVVVHGTLYFLDPDGGDREREAYAAALDLLRSVDADIMTPADVTPHRSTLFRIHADSITGRAARSVE